MEANNTITEIVDRIYLIHGDKIEMAIANINAADNLLEAATEEIEELKMALCYDERFEGYSDAEIEAAINEALCSYINE